MQASLPLPVLRRAVATTWPVTARPRGDLPALGCIQLVAEESRLRLRATDLEMMLDLTIPAQVRAAGVAAPTARDLRAILARLPPGRVHLAPGSGSAPHSLAATCRGVAAVLPGLDPALFPDARGTAGGDIVRLPAAVLKRMLTAVVFAVADAATETPGILSGGLFTLEPDRVTVVGANGFVLAVAAQEIATGLAAPRAIIVRGTVLQRLAALLPEGDDPVTLTVGTDTLAASWGTMRLIARLMDGEYPAYRHLFPSDEATEAVIARSDLAATVRAATLRPASRGYMCVLAIALGAGRVAVRGRLEATTYGATPVSGDLAAAAEARATVAGATVEAHFNARDLGAILTALAGIERVTLALRGPTRPGILHATDEDALLRYAFMPMAPRHGHAR